MSACTCVRVCMMDGGNCHMDGDSCHRQPTTLLAVATATCAVKRWRKRGMRDVIAASRVCNGPRVRKRKGALHCFVLRCIELHCITLHFALRHLIGFRCITFYCTAIRHINHHTKGPAPPVSVLFSVPVGVHATTKRTKKCTKSYGHTAAIN